MAVQRAMNRTCNRAQEHVIAFASISLSLSLYFLFFLFMENIFENILFAFQLRNVMSWTSFIRNSKKVKEREKNCHSQVIILIGANCNEFICGRLHAEVEKFYCSFQSSFDCKSTLTFDKPKRRQELQRV